MLKTSKRNDKMLATIAEMDSLIGETLQFARAEATTEIRRPTDITVQCGCCNHGGRMRRCCNSPISSTNIASVSTQSLKPCCRILIVLM